MYDLSLKTQKYVSFAVNTLNLSKTYAKINPNFCKIYNKFNAKICRSTRYSTQKYVRSTLANENLCYIGECVHQKSTLNSTQNYVKSTLNSRQNCLRLAALNLCEIYAQA